MTKAKDEQERLYQALLDHMAHRSFQEFCEIFGFNLYNAREHIVWMVNCARDYKWLEIENVRMRRTLKNIFAYLDHIDIDEDICKHYECDDSGKHCYACIENHFSKGSEGEG